MELGIFSYSTLFFNNINVYCMIHPKSPTYCFEHTFIFIQDRTSTLQI